MSPRYVGFFSTIIRAILTFKLLRYTSSLVVSCDISRGQSPRYTSLLHIPKCVQNVILVAATRRSARRVSRRFAPLADFLFVLYPTQKPVHRLRVSMLFARNTRCELYNNSIKYCGKWYNVGFLWLFFAGKKLVLCEWNMGTVILCGLFRRIRIHWVHYGYISGDSACGITHQNTCSAQNAISVLRRWCEGKAFCIVKPWNMFFRAPCGGNRKYLKLYYSC